MRLFDQISLPLLFIGRKGLGDPYADSETQQTEIGTGQQREPKFVRATLDTTEIRTTSISHVGPDGPCLRSYKKRGYASSEERLPDSDQWMIALA